MGYPTTAELHRVLIQKLCLNRLILKNFIFYSFSFLKNNHCILLGFYSF